MSAPERFPRRAERARATRRRIIDAAIARFADAGYPATPITSIAEHAEVAVQTIYATFGNKRAILAEALDVAIAGDDEPVPVNDRSWMRPVWEATDGPSTLRAYAGAVRVILERSALLFRALDVAAAAEPELGELAQTTRDRRRLGAEGVVRAAVGRTPLAPTLTFDRAVDIVWLLNGHDVYSHIVMSSGWTADEYEMWLGDTMAAQLYGAGGW